MPRIGPDTLAIGCMRLSTEPGRDEALAIATLHAALDAGVTLLDTADAYCLHQGEAGHGERLIAKALAAWAGDRARVQVATKGGLTRPGGRWEADGRGRHLREACEASLRRLRLERIDVYQLHRPDPDVPLEESVGELARLREEGKIRHVGLSNVGLEELARAQAVVPIVSVQNRYSLSNRDCDDVVDECERRGIAFLPWYPLEAGDHALPGGALGRVAGSRGATPAQVALAWLLARSPVVCPIPGTGSLRHLEENVAAAELELTPEELAAVG
jgi:aryl-alcohol dehydrogenase-like predicted oxidoreductase